MIILLIFGTKKLRNIGEDLGQAFKGFRKGLQTTEDPKSIINNSNNDEKTIEK